MCKIPPPTSIDQNSEWNANLLCCFQSKARAKDMKRAFILRRQSPLGRYPATGLLYGSDALIVRQDFVFTAACIRNTRAFPINCSVISEFEYLRLEEIRLLGAALLSLPPDAGIICFYPSIESTIVTTTGTQLEEYFVDQFRFQNNSRCNSCGRAGSQPYSFHDEALDEALYKLLVRSVKLSDFLVLRGLHALLKAHMLMQRREFGDAATIYLHIALETSFQLILKKLAENGIKNPSALDAGRYIDTIFGNTSPSGKYFEAFYEDRIKAIHPHSRYGISPYPPLAVDDFYDLRPDLIAVFVHLITGKIWDGRQYV